LVIKVYTFVFVGVPNRKLWIAVSTTWQGPDGVCRGKYVNDICVFGLGDLNKLVSERELFANKFYHDYQPLALQCMEEWMYNRTVNNIPLQKSDKISLDSAALESFNSFSDDVTH
jgi:hypothetical protein